MSFSTVSPDRHLQIQYPRCRRSCRSI